MRKNERNSICFTLAQLIIITVRSYEAQSSIGPMRPWQAQKEKSQKFKKVEGTILYGRDGSSVLVFFNTHSAFYLQLIFSSSSLDASSLWMHAPYKTYQASMLVITAVLFCIVHFVLCFSCFQSLYQCIYLFIYVFALMVFLFLLPPSLSTSTLELDMASKGGKELDMTSKAGKR